MSFSTAGPFDVDWPKADGKVAAKAGIFRHCMSTYNTCGKSGSALYAFTETGSVTHPAVPILFTLGAASAVFGNCARVIVKTCGLARQSRPFSPGRLRLAPYRGSGRAEIRLVDRALLVMPDGSKECIEGELDFRAVFERDHHVRVWSGPVIVQPLYVRHDRRQRAARANKTVALVHLLRPYWQQRGLTLRRPLIPVVPCHSTNLPARVMVAVSLPLCVRAAAKAFSGTRTGVTEPFWSTWHRTRVSRRSAPLRCRASRFGAQLGTSPA